MWFKNLIIYRLPAGWSLSAAELEARLERHALQPCSPFEMLSRGWVAPAESGRLVHTVNQQLLVALGVNQKLLPASIIRQEAVARAQALAESQGFPVGRRQMRELKMRVTEELRARAFTRRRSTRAWIDPAGGLVRRRCGEPGKSGGGHRGSAGYAGQLCRAASGHAAHAAHFDGGVAHSRGRTRPVLDRPGSGAAERGQSKAIIRYTRHPLEGPEIRSHLSAGKYPTRLGLTWNDRIAFILTEKLQIKRLEFLEMTREAVEESEIEPAEQFDIDFTVMCGELAKLLDELVQSLGGENVQPQAAAA